VSERPPVAVAEANDEATPEQVAKTKRIMKIGLIIGIVGACISGFGGYAAPGMARSKLKTWSRTDAIVTSVDVRGSRRSRRSYVTLVYQVNGQAVINEVGGGPSTDRKAGEKIAILVSPKDVKETEWASNVEAMAKNSPVAGLFRGMATGFFVFPFIAGILALLWNKLASKFTRKAA
jgi:hypothetical protein